MKWEYKVEALEAAFSNALESQLNILGSDGWELVSLTSNNWAEARCVFKRPIPFELHPVEFGEVTISRALTEEEQKVRAQQLMELLERVASPERRKQIGARE